MSSLRDTLTEIYTTQGTLTPRLVVDLASDPDHPLHDRFEWDDTIAADRYRLAQAGQLIRSVKVRYVDAPEPKDVNAFHSTPSPDGNSSYTPVEEVVRDEVGYQLVVRAMRREFEAFRRRYQHLEEFAAMLRDAAA